MPQMKLTRHNGRTGSGGAYSAKHNDRQFDLNENDHIDADRSGQNIYWDLLNGVRIAGTDNPELEGTFEDARNIEDIKSFLSRQKDTYKVPYATHPVDYKRQCLQYTGLPAAGPVKGIAFFSLSW